MIKNELLTSFQGESNPGVDTTTLYGKIMAGYQGWFRAPGDGFSTGWGHWGKKRNFKPGNCGIDIWPDMNDMDEDEKYPTLFHHAGGSTAYVFSSLNRKTVLRHFKWQKEYGIDGVFVQRFHGAARKCAADKDISSLRVLSLCREGANLHGRTYALMYDLSGMREDNWQLIVNDWKVLVDKMKLTEDPAYLHHNGAPVVSVWGLGFTDRPRYSLAPCAKIIDFLKNDPVYGGNTVKLGVPTGWREQKQYSHYLPRTAKNGTIVDYDCIIDRRLHEIIRMADIVSPWTVDRIQEAENAALLAETIWKKDFAWCEENNVEFMPVIYPGFSWHNMFKEAPFNQIPRNRGNFLWQMAYQALRHGAKMIYQAMFDEVDEGTAVLKCSNDPPVGDSPFFDMEGVPPDHYLFLDGQIGRMLRGELPLTKILPTRQ